MFLLVVYKNNNKERSSEPGMKTKAFHSRLHILKKIFLVLLNISEIVLIFFCIKTKSRIHTDPEIKLLN